MKSRGATIYDDGCRVALGIAYAEYFREDFRGMPDIVPDDPHPHGAGVGEAWRTADLWSAAPDLLAALEILVADMEEEYRDRSGDMDHDGIEKAKAAIHKAKGGES